MRDAEAALLAALGGAGIVAVLPDDGALSASFFEDLRRLGDVKVADESPQNPLERLDEEQRRLLDLLARRPRGPTPVTGGHHPRLGSDVDVALGDFVAVAEQFGDQGRADFGDEVTQGV